MSTRPRSTLRAPLLTAGVLGAVGLLLALRDPHVPGSYGVCPTYALTGLQCAGCGALRATHELVTGDLAAAWALNPLLVVAVPVVGALWLLWLGVRAGWWQGPRVTPAMVVTGWTVAAVVVLGYSVLRNVVAGAAAPV